MDFAALPPEVNSGRMYSGPGPGPLLAAAVTWDGLAAELHSTATVYGSVVSALTGEAWLGPSSAAMAAAIAPYVVWLTTTATQAEQTAAQAKAAAAAYEAAFALTVPPPVIAANRAQLMGLVATNVFGQNTPAIAATEAHYGEMWAQDAAAMYGYAASSATASALTPFTPPPQAMSSAGQAAAVAYASGSSAGTGNPAALADLISAVPGVLQGFVASLYATPVLPPALSALLSLEASVGPPLSASALSTASASWSSAAANGRALLSNGQAILDNGEVLLNQQNQLTLVQHEIRDMLGDLRRTGALTSAAPAALGGGGVSAGVGSAALVGGLAVPSSWAVAAPEIRAVAYALPASSVGAVPTAWTGTAGTAYSQMALAGAAGSVLGSTVSGGRPTGPGLRERAGVVPPKSLQISLSSPLAGIAGELRELAALRDAGILTEQEFSGQKRRLLSR